MPNNSSISFDGLPIGFSPHDVIFIVLGFLIIIFNACVLVVLWKRKVLQKTENALLGSLAISDISVGLIGLPLLFTCSYTPLRLCIFCYISMVFFKFISISTLLHILVIITDRYLRVVFPFLHRRLLAKTNRLTYLIIFIWLLSLSVANVQWIWTYITCVGDHTEDIHHHMRYELVCFGVFFIIPLLLITFFLTTICLAARRYFHDNTDTYISRTPRTRSPYAELRVSIVLFTMFFLFLVCWFPYFYALLSAPLHLVNPPWLEGAAVPILRCLTATLNPIIYTFYKEDFYQAIRQFLCCAGKNEVTHGNDTRERRAPVNGNDTRESLIIGSKCDNAHAQSSV